MGLAQGVLITAIIDEFDVTMQQIEQRFRDDDDLLTQFVEARRAMEAQNRGMRPGPVAQEPPVFVTGQNIAPTSAKDESNKCKVCWENESTHAFNNCGHKCICLTCALQ